MNSILPKDFSACATVRNWLRKLTPLLVLCVAVAVADGAENVASTSTERPLVLITNALPVQMFVPGFTAKEIPITLKNLTSIRYRRDGKLLAAGYDGTIWLLSDTNGDGLEDKVEPYWDKGTLRVPLGLAETPSGYPHGQGVFIPNVGKLSLLLDKDGDDRADEEIVAATGWPDVDSRSDALGVAVGPDGSVYFGIGIGTAYNNAYRLDKQTGEARYDLRGERGAILRVSPELKSREVFVTGVRFTMGLAFNRHGDLFATEQEGATWLPNGNSLDELLHIQRGRHYGFPPRHPKHLPNVFDEPSVFDYAPQHQSTCGLFFNEPVSGGPTFGPTWWESDALVSGYTRGKIYRTKLVKTAAGYVAQSQLIAQLQSLAVDLCISPRGDLVVATHGGKPDWGSGPQKEGHVFHIQFTDANTPQPVLAWSDSPTQLRVAFDRPLPLGRLTNIAARTTITQGEFVFSGDRFETIRPGYEVVRRAIAAPRFDVPVLSVNLTPDQRSLLIRTPPRTLALNFGVTLPSTTGGQIDLLSDLTGVEGQWTSADGKTNWSGWLPHLDMQVSRELTASLLSHQFTIKPGTLALRGQLDLWQMLQPAIQPGSKLDYDCPTENVRLAFESSMPFNATIGARSARSTASASGRHRAELDLRAPGQTWQRFEIQVQTSADPLAFTVAWSTDEDARPRALALRRFLLPWASPKSDAPAGESERRIPELAGGDWQRGREVFLTEKAACSNCHTAQGVGGKVGPDLSNLIHRDYASVLKDIREPNASINPDHLAFNFEMSDGETLSGIIQRETSEQIILADAAGKPVTLARSKAKKITPATLSLMPEGLDKALTAGELRDLMTFLLMPREAASPAATPTRR